MSRERWLKDRKTGIGGTDAAAILGLSPWRTPLGVYLSKVEEGPEGEAEETEAMRWGRYLEPVIRQRYADETGRTVVVPEGVVRHPQYPFIIGSLDGIADGRVLEIKTARSVEGWGEPGSDDIPDHYAAQVHHYLVVTGLEAADVAVLFGGSDFRLYHLSADPDLQAALIEKEREFWDRVLRRDPPPPTTVSDAVRLFGRKAIEDSVTASAELEQHVATLRNLRVEEAVLEKEEEAAKAAIMAALGHHSVLVGLDGKPLVTWKASSPAARFDLDRFKKEHPDLWAKYTIPGTPFRRFLLK